MKACERLKKYFCKSSTRRAIEWFWAAGPVRVGVGLRASLGLRWILLGK
jgi:hypothetical protein